MTADSRLNHALKDVAAEVLRQGLPPVLTTTGLSREICIDQAARYVRYAIAVDQNAQQGHE